jgi:hypothetical protein
VLSDATADIRHWNWSVSLEGIKEGRKDMQNKENAATGALKYRKGAGRRCVVFETDGAIKASAFYKRAFDAEIDARYHAAP